MISPYFAGGGAPSFMPPPGLMEGLAARDKQLQEDGKSIGKMAGGLVSGVSGAFQGAGAAKAGGVFEPGTSVGSGAMQGFARNWQASQGEGGGGMGGLASLVQGGGASGGGGAGFTGGMNMKQFAALGKTADSLREAMRTSIPTVEGQDPKVFGMTDDEWKHAGTDRKISSLQAYQQAQALQAQQQGYELGKMHMAEYAAQIAKRKQDEQANAQVGPFMQRYTTLTSVPEGTATNMVEQNPPVGMKPAAAWAAANQAYPLAASSPQFDNTLTAYSKLTGAAPGEVFDASGAVVNVGGWNVPTIKTSKGQVQAFPELATDSNGKQNPRFNRPVGVSANAELASVTQQLRALYAKTQGQRAQPDIAERIKKLEAQQEALMGSNNVGGAGGTNLDPLGLF